MRKFLILLVFSMLIFSCDESTEPPPLPVEDWLATDRDWGEYAIGSYASLFESHDVGYFNMPIITLNSKGYNIVGINRGPINEVMSYSSIHLDFSYNDFYYDIEDGSDIEPGTLTDSSNNYVDYNEDSRNIYIDLQDILQDTTDGINDNLQIGDEFAKINIYADEAHQTLVETFSLIL